MFIFLSLSQKGIYYSSLLLLLSIYCNAYAGGAIYENFNNNSTKGNVTAFNKVGLADITMPAYDASCASVGSAISVISPTYNTPRAIVPDMNVGAVAACSVTVNSATPTACEPATNRYNLAVAVSYSEQPSGNITINVGGTDYTFTPDGTSPDTYTVMGLISDGVQNIDVSATFVGDAACTNALVDAYDAPANCFCGSSTCLLSASFFQDVVLGFDGTLYTSEGTANNGTCTVDGSYDMTVDASGNIYVSSSLTNTVLKFDPNGNCLGEFITAGSGGLNNPRGLTFLPNGDLLVNSHNGQQILRYDGTTGAFIGIFSDGSDISPIASMSPHMTIKYGPDGAVWVADHTNNRILRFDAATGAFLSVFAQLPAGSGVRSFEFMGNYVLISYHNNDLVVKYDYYTGAYVGDFANLADGIDGPTGITYGPDGKVYIGSLNTNQIVVFDTDGTVLSSIAVNSPKDILFKCGECFVAATCSVTVTSATPTACSADTYDLAVAVTYSNPPTGNITINVGGTNYTFTPDGTSPDTYTVNDLTANGTQNIDVSATFVGDAACTHNLVDAYDAPASCAVACPTATNPGTCNNNTLTNSTLEDGAFTPTGTFVGSPYKLISNEGTSLTDWWVNKAYWIDAQNTGRGPDGSCRLVWVDPSYGNSVCIYPVPQRSLVANQCYTMSIWAASFDPNNPTAAQTMSFDIVTNSSSEQYIVVDNNGGGTVTSFDDGPYGVVSTAINLSGNTAPLDMSGNPFTNAATQTLDWSSLDWQLVTITFHVTQNISADVNYSINDNTSNGVAFDNPVFGSCCSQPCALTITSTTPTACDPNTNNYSLNVSVSYSNPPTGNITINVGGTDYTFTPNGSGSETFTVMGLVSNGTAGIDVSATFVGDAACTHNLVDAYDAPVSCSPPFVACGDIPVIWLVDEDQPAPSMHLWSFKDYNDATNTGTDYGRVTYIDPITGDTTAFATSSSHGDMESMAVNQSTGQAYFLTASKIPGGPSGQTLFTYNLNDAAANKGKIAFTVIGHIQRPNTQATEVLALYNNRLYLADPVTGGENNDLTTDILMSVDLGALNPDVMQLTIPTIIGPIQGLGQTNNYVDGMEILPNGTLYTIDGTDDHLYRVSLATGAILEVIDNNVPGGIDPNADVETIVWDPVNNKLIGSDNKLQQFVDLTLDGINGNNIVTSPYIGTPGIYSLVDFEGSAMFVMCCELMVNSAMPSACDVNGQYTLSVDVTYTNISGDITINGQTFTPSGVTGRDTFVLVLLTADGAIDVDVTAQSITEVTCSATLADAYDAPASCLCNLSASADGTNVLCNGGTDGTATATASGNIAAVTYAWSNGGTTATISNLAAGTYSVTISESASCTAVASYTVTEPAILDITCDKTDVTTNGGADGTATVNATGGTSPYTYLWNSGETTATISGKTSGTYTVTVTDANGCTALCNSTINEPGCNLSAAADGTNVLCNGGTDGTATATASGNIAAVTYAWSNGGTTATISNLTAGTYSVTITETASCTAVASYTVTEPAILDITCDKTDVTTIGGTDGTASVVATGGTSPYAYLWNSGETTASISNKTSGTYTVTVTDANNCTAICNSTINEPGCNLSASADGTNVLCNGGTDGTATATASGNIAAVTYAWSNGGTTATISNLAAGTYSVTISESASCTAVASYTVTEPAILDITCDKTDVTTNGGSDGTATVSATGGTSPYTYLWNSGETTASISSKTSGTYTVTVTDANGCNDVCSSSINEPGALCNLTSAGLAGATCNDNGTSADATDDYISFTLNPTGTTLGTGYIVTVSSGSITPNTANYGSASNFQLQNGSAGSGNTITVTITDASDTNCKVQVDVSDPGSCSTPTCPPVKCLPISITKN
jgi:streptogramin lyase